VLSKISIQAAPLRNKVTEKIREAIAAGKLRPGEHLRERELCEQLGVSRTSIREALRVLESEGLLTSVPNKGVAVASISQKESEDVYETRAVLEGLLVRQFVRNATDQQIAKLSDIVDAIDKQNQRFNITKFVELKTKFYDLIMEGADNKVAANALRAIHARVARLWVTSLSNPTRASQSVVEIREIVDAMKARDEQAAFEACSRHIGNAFRNITQIRVASEERSHSEDGTDDVQRPVSPRKRTLASAR
jgi:DNA-binding GntR family transcriptional regulator